MDQVSFTRMEDGTTAEFEHIVSRYQQHKAESLVDNLFGLLRSMKGPTLGYAVDRYEHSIQTATRAERSGARDDLIVAALLHDIGDPIAPDNHSEAAASILSPYLDEEATWVVRHHGVFQGYHYWDKLGLDANARDVYRDSPWFDICALFCAEWDQTAFDPDYDSEPLEHFEPLVRAVFARPANGFDLPAD